jgi:multisubunit Na+/H+ antiporter MnhB subunit
MEGMTIIVKKITQLIAGMIFVFGMYIVLHGHLSPGGGFAGGALMAGAFILLVLSNGSAYLTIVRNEKGSARLESAAILCFLVLAGSAMVHGSLVFFRNFLSPGVPGRFFSAG